MRTDAWKDSVTKLDSRFGDYQLIVKCPKCGYQRTMLPIVLANVVGWTAEIATVMKRMKCSRCHHRGATHKIEKTPVVRGRGIR